ncbi:hypothetical protein PCK1_001333 [Pneumocystis canis]|nr:hypothetical protein PCK1_001333 [Pneumocystis canis]
MSNSSCLINAIVESCSIEIIRINMNDSTNIFDEMYYSGMNILDQIKIAYSSPKRCLNSYWCLIPMILLLLITIIIVLSLYYCFARIIQTCCCCFSCCRPGASFVQTKPTVVVQPTVVPSYPMYVYKETPWMSQETKAQYRQTNNYKPPLKYMTQWSSPCRKKLLKNDQEICRTPPVRTSYNESYHDFSPDLPLELSNLYDKENLDNYGTNYEVESPSRNDIKPVCHRQHLSEFSINSIFDRQTPNNTMKRLKSVQYTDNTIAHDGISDEIDSNYSPDIYNKTRNYSKF